MRPLIWLLTSGLVVAAIGVVLLIISSRRSLDSEFQHSRASAALPFLSPETADGLVQIRARGMVFRARVAGLQGDGTALLLLHGFPETSIMWEELIASASAAGHRVVAFDQRGYSPGARPDGIESYQVPELVADAFAVADAVGFGRFHLVGHDWGAIIGWLVAAQDRDRVLSYAALSIPHPGAVAQANAESGTPFYVRIFRTPGLAETLFTARGLAVMQRALYSTMPRSHREEYLAVFSEPGALRAALNWYRAMSPTSRSLAEIGMKIAQPVLYLFGNADLPTYVRPEVRALQANFLTGPFESIELGAGHWLIQEKPKEVVEAVLDHVGSLE